MPDQDPQPRVPGEPEPVKPHDIRVPEKWALHFRVLQSLRKRLLAERDAEISEVTGPVEQHSMDLADSASDEFDHERALSLLAHEQDTLYEVDAAIHRILDGTYGLCEETGEAIPAVRLLAVPWTRFSKDTQERMEKAHKVAPVHLGQLASVKNTVLVGGLDGIKASQEDETDVGEDDEQELLPFRHDKVVSAIENSTLQQFAPLPDESDALDAGDDET